MITLNYRQLLLLGALAVTLLFGWSAIVTPATAAAGAQLDRAGQRLYELTGLADLAASVEDHTTDLETAISDSGVNASLVTSVEDGLR